MTEEEYGHYVIVRYQSKITDEGTNIGVMIFDSFGKKIFQKMDTLDRARKRGDCEANWDVSHWPNKYDSLEQIHRSLDSLGHAMSCVQNTPPRATLIYEGVLEDICKSFGIGHVSST